MKIVLVGYRASGKSTLAQLLSKALNWPQFDIDRGIEEHIDTSLTEYYQRVGEGPFRRLETQVVRHICANDQCVISFGAGSCGRPENQALARANALVVYLQVSVDELWRRIQSDPISASTRPNLAGGGRQEVVEMLSQREPIYRRIADLILDGQQPPQTLAAQVMQHYRALEQKCN